MKRRQFLTVTGAAVTAAACTPPPEPPKPVADAQRQTAETGLEKFDNFPLRPMRGKYGFAMTMEGLCAFVLPNGGLKDPKRLDALLVRGGKDHEHKPSLFVPRQVWMHEVQGTTLAEPVALDPNHAVFALDGMRVKVVQEGMKLDQKGNNIVESLSFNKDPKDNTVCPASIETLAGFRWLLDFATELAVADSEVKIAANWRKTYDLYHTHIELLAGRIEHADDLKNARTAAVGHQWELAPQKDPTTHQLTQKTRYLKEILHYGLPEQRVTQIKLEPIAGGDAQSIFVDSKNFFAPVGVMHVAKHYTAPEDVKENRYKAKDLSALSNLIPNVTFKIPKLVKLKACVVSRTPECGCCPPGFIEDLP